MVDARVYTVIETEDSDRVDTHFEWHGSKTILVVKNDGDLLDSFALEEVPTKDQVIQACLGYFNE